MDDLGPYSRVYWFVLTDDKFLTIRDDARMMGTWLFLLLQAEMMFPQVPFIPPSVPKTAYARLVALGIIDDLGDRRYKVHGLEVERERRSKHATRAAEGRWNGASGEHRTSIARASGEHMPSTSTSTSTRSRSRK